MIQEEWKDYIRRLQEQNKRLKISEAEEEKNNYQNRLQDIVMYRWRSVRRENRLICCSCN